MAKAYQSRDHLRATDGQPLCLTRGKVIYYAKEGTPPTCRRCVVLSSYVYQTRKTLHGVLSHAVALLDGELIRVLCGEVPKADLEYADSIRIEGKPSCPRCIQLLERHPPPTRTPHG